ncbi:MAG: hypothetical protein HZC48_02535 [Nitrospirae bacterium]|nr:hypothetical protein [Nitrospirota bacterium]
MRLRISITAGVLSLMASLAWSQDCHQSAILSPGPFTGTNGEIFKLVDGSLWEVKVGMNGMKLCEYNPDVMICPSWGKLVIKGNSLSVEQVKGEKQEPESQSRTASATK